MGRKRVWEPLRSTLYAMRATAPIPVSVPLIIRLGMLCICVVAAGCSGVSDWSLVGRSKVETPAPSDRLPLPADGSDVVGEVQVTFARHTDTLHDIARRYDLGYEEIVAANPGVDPWLPGEGARIVLPTQFVLPDGPREGLVLNLAAMRLFYFPEPGDGETAVVIALSAAHRRQVFDALRYAIDRIKEIVPVWKKEVWADGAEWKSEG